MKPRTLYALIVTAGLALVAWAGPSATAAPEVAAVEVSPKVATLISELTRQNKLLTENQAQMDEKLDRITEMVRQARIYSARSGGKGGAK